MKVKVFPSQITPFSTIDLPPSKSIAHRAIICASLANGISKLENVELSEDILATINAMKLINANLVLKDQSLLIDGCKNHLKNTTHEINCKESGSTLRFCIPLFALLNHNSIFIGEESLFKRPLFIYQELFQSLGLMFVLHKNYLSIHGPLKGGNYKVKGNISSQFISGLLFSLPLCEENSILEITGDIESYSYILLTIHILKLFQINIELIDKNKFFIQGKQQYYSRDLTIEGDFSQLAYLSLLAILSQPITFRNINFNSFQGDKVYLHFLKQLNIKVEAKENQLTIYPSTIKGCELNMSDCPDLALALCGIGMFSHEEIILTNCQRLKYKESNRIESILTEFKKWGVNISYHEGSLHISKIKEKYTYHKTLSSHHDHRVFMTLFICAICGLKPVIIEDAECVYKSFPSFYEKMKQIGVQFEFLK